MIPFVTIKFKLGFQVVPLRSRLQNSTFSRNNPIKKTGSNIFVVSIPATSVPYPYTRRSPMYLCELVCGRKSAAKKVRLRHVWEMRPKFFFLFDSEKRSKIRRHRIESCSGPHSVWLTKFSCRGFEGIDWMHLPAETCGAQMGRIVPG